MARKAPTFRGRPQRGAIARRLTRATPTTRRKARPSDSTMGSVYANSRAGPSALMSGPHPPAADSSRLLGTVAGVTSRTNSRIRKRATRPIRGVRRAWCRLVEWSRRTSLRKSPRWVRSSQLAAAVEAFPAATTKSGDPPSRRRRGDVGVFKRSSGEELNVRSRFHGRIARSPVDLVPSPRQPDSTAAHALHRIYCAAATRTSST